MPEAGLGDESSVSKANRVVSAEVFNRATGALKIEELYRIRERKERC